MQNGDLLMVIKGVNKVNKNDRNKFVKLAKEFTNNMIGRRKAWATNALGIFFAENGEKFVEFVGDTPREPLDGFQLLELTLHVVHVAIRVAIARRHGASSCSRPLCHATNLGRLPFLLGFRLR